MEKDILKTLEHKITVPTARDFLECFLKAAHADKKTGQLACYVLDSTLLSYDLNQYLPSQLAAAAVFIARRTVGWDAWSQTLVRFTNYSEEDISSVARAVLAEKQFFSRVRNEGELITGVNRKYSKARYGSVADTVLASDF